MRTLALALLLCMAGMGPAAAERFRVSVSDANAAPYVLYEQGEFRGGIARDLMDELGRALGLTPEYLNLPRGRVVPFLRQGEIEAACFLAPAWVDQPETLVWSPILLQIHQVIVSRQPSIAIRSPEQLFGRRLGTLLNYVYPELEPYFADRRIQRDDSPTLAASLLKLEHGRIDALIDTDLSVFYLTEHMKPATPLRIDPLWAPPSPVHCAFNAEFAKAYPQALARLDLMVKDGQVQRWVEAYTGGRRLEIAVSEP